VVCGQCPSPTFAHAIEAVVVRSDRQRRGIGRALLAHAIRQAAVLGLSQVAGLVLPENTAMLALARAMGFGGFDWKDQFIEICQALPGRTRRAVGRR
jgi:GNAT superfamily N-acetyltransferase